MACLSVSVFPATAPHESGWPAYPPCAPCLGPATPVARGPLSTAAPRGMTPFYFYHHMDHTLCEIVLICTGSDDIIWFRRIPQTFWSFTVSLTPRCQEHLVTLEFTRHAFYKPQDPWAWTQPSLCFLLPGVTLFVQTHPQFCFPVLLSQTASVMIISVSPYIWLSCLSVFCSTRYVLKHWARTQGKTFMYTWKCL